MLGRRVKCLPMSRVRHQKISHARVSQFIHRTGLRGTTGNLCISPGTRSSPLFRLRCQCPGTVFSRRATLFLLKRKRQTPLAPAVALLRSSNATHLGGRSMAIEGITSGHFAVNLTSTVAVFKRAIHICSLRQAVYSLFHSHDAISPRSLRSTFRGCVEFTRASLIGLVGCTHRFQLIGIVHPCLRTIVPT